MSIEQIMRAADRYAAAAADPAHYRAELLAIVAAALAAPAPQYDTEDEQRWPNAVTPAPQPSKLVEAVAKAIMFEDSGSTEGWQDNTNLAEAAIRVCDARNPPRCSHCHSATSQPAREITASSAGPSSSVKPVAFVVENLDENEARIRYMFNPVPAGAELQWDHGITAPEGKQT